MSQARATVLLGPRAGVLAAARSVLRAIPDGAHGLRRPGMGEDVWQVRPYAAGDDSQRIDWRRSARADRLMVRDVERIGSRTLHLWCDGAPTLAWSSRPDQPRKADAAAILASAVALYFARGGERLRDSDGGPCRSDQPLITPALDRPQLHHDHSVILFSDGLRADWAAWCAQHPVRPGQGVLVRITDPAERDFPYHGTALFQSMDGQGRRQLADADSLRARYLAAFDAHQQSVRTAAEASGWRVIDIDSHGDWTAPLSAALSALAKGRV